MLVSTMFKESNNSLLKAEIYQYEDKFVINYHGPTGILKSETYTTSKTVSDLEEIARLWVENTNVLNG